MENKKRCFRCGELKVEHAFDHYKNKSLRHKDKRRKACKVCVANKPEIVISLRISKVQWLQMHEIARKFNMTLTAYLTYLHMKIWTYEQKQQTLSERKEE